MIGWRDGDDPYEPISSMLPRECRVAIGDRMWASHVLALQRAAPGVAFEPASRIIGRLRAVKDADELGALRRARRAAPTRRSGRSAACASWGAGRRRSRPTWRSCWSRTGIRVRTFTIVAIGAERRVATS